MRALVFGCAAIAACGLAAPAAAGTPDDGRSGFIGVQSGGNFDDRDHHRRHDSDIGIWVNSGEWARYNNQSWQPSGFNDWWHDRPDRAYPAWVRNNQGCKQWYAGSTLRC